MTIRTKIWFIAVSVAVTVGVASWGRAVITRARIIKDAQTSAEELARVQSNDVILPTLTHGEIRLRCVTQPDAAQAALLERLGIVLPKRIRLSELDLPAVEVA